jgi:hypothetical protein
MTATIPLFLLCLHGMLWGDLYLYLYFYRTIHIFSIAPKALLSQVYLLLLSVYLILTQLLIRSLKMKGGKLKHMVVFFYFRNSQQDEILTERIKWSSGW